MRDETARTMAVARGDKITLPDLLDRRGPICGICGEPIVIPARDPMLKPSIDHKVPISRGGRHRWANVQPAHLLCNIRKRDRMPYEAWEGRTELARWIREQAYLDFADELAERVADRVFARLAGLFTRGATVSGDGQEAA
jgi:hypothetical protein